MKINLIVLRASNIDRLADFYRAMGIEFEKHRHGNGPLHLGAELDGLTLEIYPRRNETDSTASLRLGFQVESIDETLERIESLDYTLVSPPKDSPWGRRMVIDDIEGHRLEITEKQKAT